MTSSRLVREGRILGRDGAVTELALTTPCQTCQNRCLAGTLGQQRFRIEIANSLPSRPGQRVHIAVSRSDLTLACAVLFGIPLLAWVCGGVIGSHLWGEAGGVLLALIMLGGAFLGIHASRRSLRRWAKL
ncbi:MAG: SoxR reducing system RseC family protein, partial [Gammaproteobacteria bacterium]|nr:SoxR reducing system RseC family protein [Gammaproteobacteria bacterium]